MAKMSGKSVSVSGHIGRSANKQTNSGKDPFLMAGSKIAASNDMANRPPKVSTTKHGSSFIASAKKGC